MTPSEALKLARKTWGKGAGCRRNKWPSSQRKRDAARAKLAELGPEPKAPNWNDPTEWPDHRTVGDFRAAFAEYKAARQAWLTARDNERSELNYYQFAVGAVTGGGMFFGIKGQGDSWEDAFVKAGVKVPGYKLSNIAAARGSPEVSADA